MSGITGIGGSSIETQLASGKRINSAADDASGLAISEKLKEQRNGLDVGAENIQDGISALNIADGGADQITDYLQRIRELSLKAANGLNGAEERESIQMEVDQLLDGIRQASLGTSFNEKELLDGSMADLHIASNPDGSGMEIRMADVTLETLGIADYDVTGDFDISRIDDALKQVMEKRSSLGAATNRLEHAYRYNTNASEQLTASQSRIEDLEMGSGVVEQKKKETIQNYQNLLLRKKMEDDSLVLKLFQ